MNPAVKSFLPVRSHPGPYHLIIRQGNDYLNKRSCMIISSLAMLSKLPKNEIVS